HSCAVRSTGEVACWGLNEDGQLGNGASGEGIFEATPVGVVGLVDAVSVAAGNFHTCALRATGEVACWGAGRLGELGSPDALGAVEPLPITSLTDVVEISAGYTHTCARRASGEVACWGLNRYGQLGFESEEEIVREP